MVRIPEELVALAAERRLIPFVGAGFSASLGLPSWQSMLRTVCEKADGALDFDDLLAATNGDLLQVAEYLYLKHDKQIGPIRHVIDRRFGATHTDPLESGPHVELVNLGAGQIYTTNYDDIIESVYRSLNLPVTPVILPKDVALADTEKTQVVKYHGDLTHERTLVLTESAYYKRLDFESPMDLKFRSDLLGKSVLFMGYSFRDINIRIIWFKLMEMMRDIPEADRRPSYIVRIESNPALEELYAAVGLKTLVLSPRNAVLEDGERTRLLGDFLLNLSMRASTRARRRGGAIQEVFVSAAAIALAHERAESMKPYSGASFGFRYTSSLMGPDEPILSRIFTGTVPPSLFESWQACAEALLPYCAGIKSAVFALERLDASQALTNYVVNVLTATGAEEARQLRADLIAMDSVWPKAWKFRLDGEVAGEILQGLSREIRYQATEGADEDLAYMAELATRIDQGLLLVDSPETAPYRERARTLLDLAAQIYPEVLALTPDQSGPPAVADLLAAIETRRENFRPVEVANERTIARGRVPRSSGGSVAGRASGS